MLCGMGNALVLVVLKPRKASSHGLYSFVSWSIQSSRPDANCCEWEQNYFHDGFDFIYSILCFEMDLIIIHDCPESFGATL